jgi:hypothetical protein
MLQTLFEQVVLVTCLEVSTVHVTPQPPQLLGSSTVWVSQPVSATLLQFLYLSCSVQQVVVISMLAVGGIIEERLDILLYCFH